jgi:hypothetical protein
MSRLVLTISQELTMPISAHFTRAAAGVALTGAVLFAAAAPAQATTNATPGQVESVCANDLAVRSEPGGAWFDYLYRGENFLVHRLSPSGQWVYGHAYGHVHADGWVQNGWFC